MDSQVSAILRAIPNVHECITALAAKKELNDVPLQRIKYCVRLYLDTLRKAILRGEIPKLADRGTIFEEVSRFIVRYHLPRFTRVINATGIVIHTNLGRSILPEPSLTPLCHAAGFFSNLEFDLLTGKRGSRYALVEQLLCELTGAEAALVVNNNAAAVMIALETLASGKEVVVSRGQLVEIGGSFRIPDIMARSGAHLVEVGTTNRTHLRDYATAITSETSLLLKVHCSNYRIIGFTSEVINSDLVQLGRQHNIAVMEDLGSGCLVDLSRFGLMKEPTVQEVVASGMDIVTFSGDKLLGGPQAGIIVGKKYYITQIKNNPLNRALRIDKLTLASLEAVLRLYLDESRAVQEIPTLAMIATPEAVLQRRALELCQQCRSEIGFYCNFEVVQVQSQVGGGAMPGQNLPSWAVAVRPLTMKLGQFEKHLRRVAVPVIGRVEEDRLLLDMRTVSEDECNLLRNSLRSALAERSVDTSSHEYS